MMNTLAKMFSSALLALILTGFSGAVYAKQPNIVVVFLDNFGWGEPGFNGGGIIRGSATRRLGRPPALD